MLGSLYDKQSIAEGSFAGVNEPIIDRVNFLPVPNGSQQSPGLSGHDSRRNSSTINGLNGNEIDIP